MKNRLRITIITLLGIIFIGQGQETITICWDVSYSMKDRNLDKELKFLDSVILQSKVTKIQVLLFSNQVEEENFSIEDGNWMSLKEKLTVIPYDGATNYLALNSITKRGKTFVFTDGNKTASNDMLSLNQDEVIVNSSAQADFKTLQLWALLNRSVFVDLSGELDSSLDENENYVRGVVYFDGKPASNILINTSQGLSLVTDIKGQFSYKGNIGDTLRINGTEGSEREVIVQNFEEETQFFLDSKTVALDEVVVSEERLKDEEVVNLGYTSIEREKAGFAVYDIPEDRISEVETTVTDVLQEVPGLEISSNSPLQDGSRSGGLSAARIRGRGSISFDPKVLVVVDGVPQQRSRTDSYAGVSVSRNASYDHIDPQNIASIQVLKGLAATNLFGTEGAGGVIVITTKSGSLQTKGDGKPIDRARLTDNIFEGKLTTKKGQLDTPYLKELKKEKDLKKAYGRYLVQRELYKKDFWYFVDVSDYIRTANELLADRVLSNLIEIKYDYIALRTAYLKYQNLGNQEMIMRLAEKMVNVYPKKIQAYYDLASAYQDQGNYESAVNQLQGIVSGALDANLDFSPLNKLAGTTLRNLVNQHRSKLDLAKIDAAYKNNLTYNARLTFSWTSPQDEFRLKFVNPQKRFFDWEHSSFFDKKRISDEARLGFSTEQFEIVGDMTIGKWGIYVTNLSSEGSAPYWVKCSIDYNFGKPNQRSEEKLIRVDPSDTKEQLFFEFTAN